MENRGGDLLSRQNAQLLSENRMLKQIIAKKELKLMNQEVLFKKVRTTQVKRMDAQQFDDDSYPVSRMLKILRLARSSYYYNFDMTTGK